MEELDIDYVKLGKKRNSNKDLYDAIPIFDELMEEKVSRDFNMHNSKSEHTKPKKREASYKSI